MTCPEGTHSWLPRAVEQRGDHYIVTDVYCPTCREVRSL